MQRDYDQLKEIWEAASDFLMAESNEAFAREHGGVEALKAILIERVETYEIGRAIDCAQGG